MGEWCCSALRRHISGSWPPGWCWTAYAAALVAAPRGLQARGLTLGTGAAEQSRPDSRSYGQTCSQRWQHGQRSAVCWQCCMRSTHTACSPGLTTAAGCFPAAGSGAGRGRQCSSSA